MPGGDGSDEGDLSCSAFFHFSGGGHGECGGCGVVDEAEFEHGFGAFCFFVLLFHIGQAGAEDDGCEGGFAVVFAQEADGGVSVCEVRGMGADVCAFFAAALCDGGEAREAPAPECEGFSGCGEAECEGLSDSAGGSGDENILR